MNFLRNIVFFVAFNISICSVVAADSLWDEIAWQPRIAFTMKNLDIDQEIVGNGGLAECDNTPCSGDLDVDLPSYTFSLGAALRGFYIAASYSDSFGDTTKDSNLPFTGVTTINPATGQEFRSSAETEINRTEYSFTVGYNFWRGASVFAGYLDQETELEPTPAVEVFDVNEQGLVPIGNLAQLMQDSGLGQYKQKYEEDGYFIGLGYGFNIRDIGNLSVSVAYADLDAAFGDNFLFEDQSGNVTNRAELDFEGDATGLSYALTWSQPFNDLSGYYIDVRYQDFDLDYDNIDGFYEPAIANNSVPVLSASIGYQMSL